MGLELLHRLGGVIDEGEAGGLAATELCPQAEDADLVLVGLVETSKLFPEVLLGDVGAVGVEDVTASRRKKTGLAIRSRACSVNTAIETKTPRSIPPGCRSNTGKRRRATPFPAHRPISRRNVASMAAMVVMEAERRAGERCGGEVAGREFVGDSHDHLLAAQQRVANELARTQGDGGVGISHLRGWMVMCVLRS